MNHIRTELSDIKSESDIKLLVDTFYKKVIVDPVIGYIFTDVAKISLEKHLPKMYSFWNTLLLGVRSYDGNPMLQHLSLNEQTPLNEAHFQRWMHLWQETIGSLFQGDVADEAVKRASSIALLMQHKIERAKLNQL
jgi:hemoglobin